MSACANKSPKRPEIKEYFVTDIKNDGSKHFSYSLVMKISPKQKNRNFTVRKNRRNSGDNVQNKRNTKNKTNNTARLAPIEDKFYEMLEAKLVATAFCRDGYFTLDSYIGKSKSQLRGECNETAEVLPNK